MRRDVQMPTTEVTWLTNENAQDRKVVATWMIHAEKPLRRSSLQHGVCLVPPVMTGRYTAVSAEPGWSEA